MTPEQQLLYEQQLLIHTLEIEISKLKLMVLGLSHDLDVLKADYTAYSEATENYVKVLIKSFGEPGVN